jgi:GNAT superfamily N-acetyltransferase
MPADERRLGGAGKKAAMRRTIEAGTPVGILAHLDGEPVAWCSIAPRSTYTSLDSKGTPSQDGENVWSLVCFFVQRRLRGQGIAARLIEAAIEHARGKGATVIEAYPVDADSPSFGYGGRVSTYEKAGFHETGLMGKRRHVMRLALG